MGYVGLSTRCIIKKGNYLGSDYLGKTIYYMLNKDVNKLTTKFISLLKVEKVVSLKASFFMTKKMLFMIWYTQNLVVTFIGPVDDIRDFAIRWAYTKSHI